MAECHISMRTTNTFTLTHTHLHAYLHEMIIGKRQHLLIGILNSQRENCVVSPNVHIASLFIIHIVWTSFSKFYVEK